ncbi:MAG: RebB family R body protein [Lysobacter sp.]|nr:RebB family R body protein [Lysobacter sp.]
MSDTDTTVNPMITDAVTQTNVKVLGEAPAVSMSSIDQSIAQATGILFQNAVSAQQQQNIAALAATNQGIIQIYSVDTMAAAGATANLDIPDHQALLVRAQQAMDATRVSSTSAYDGVAPQIEAAVKLANEAALENASAFAYAVRVNGDAVAASLQAIDKAFHDGLMRTVQTAATAACLEGMLRNPEKAEDYKQVLDAIKHLD